jgi:hypothetical protein
MTCQGCRPYTHTHTSLDERGLINDRFAPPCRLNSDIAQGPRSAKSCRRCLAHPKSEDAFAKEFT